MPCPQVTLTFPERLQLPTITLQTGLFIENEFVESESGSTFETTNPTTGVTLAEISAAQPSDIDRAVQAARRAFDVGGDWGTEPPLGGSYRADCMFKLAQAIDENKEILAAIETLDNGKVYQSGIRFEIPACVSWLKYFAGWADKQCGQTVETDPTKFVYTLHEPLGVVGQIIPWNFPLLMFVWKLAPPLAIGNTVILKPAEQTSLSALYVCTLIQKIFPKGVINVVPGMGPIAGEALVKHPEVDKIGFTGSTAVGKLIMSKAAQSNLKPVTLELGGKSPNIVFEDADIEQAVKWAAFANFFNQGQCCTAGSRLYVQESIYEQFMNAFVQHIKRLKVGDPFDEQTFQGPQVSQIHCDRIMGYIKSGLEEGADCLVGGRRIGHVGQFIEPTVFVNVKPEMKIMKEEIFGPVIVVCKFQSEEDVVSLANDSIFGLAAGIHSKNINRIIRVSRQLKAGTVWVNCYNRLYPQSPFGGFKQSGIGRENGKYILKEYTEVKTVLVNVGEQL